MSDVYLKIRHAKRQNAQNLDLSHQNISHVPEDVYNLKYLLNLNLSNNSLSKIDKLIENLKNLSELNLESNQIENLPIELAYLNNLKNVNIKNNPIESKLIDWNLNWKQSLKNFYEIKLNEDQNSNSDNKIIKIKETNIINNNLEGIQDGLMTETNHKKTPFSFNMSNTKLSFMNNTVTKFNKKPIYEIPKCQIFDNHKDDNFAKQDLSNSQNNHIKKSEEITFDQIKKDSSQNNLKRIQSGKINKKEALNAVLKLKSRDSINDTLNNQFDINEFNKTKNKFKFESK